MIWIFNAIYSQAKMRNNFFGTMKFELYFFHIYKVQIDILNYLGMFWFEEIKSNGRLSWMNAGLLIDHSISKMQFLKLYIPIRNLWLLYIDFTRNDYNFICYDFLRLIPFKQVLNLSDGLLFRYCLRLMKHFFVPEWILGIGLNQKRFYSTKSSQSYFKFWIQRYLKKVDRPNKSIQIIEYTF